MNNQIGKTRSRALNRLSAREVETASTPGAYMDGGGLLLRISDSGGKKWLFRYTSPVTGKRREMGLGRADKGHVPLKAAREAAQAARDLVARKIDPIDQAERERRERLAEAKKATPKTFGEFADEWIEATIKPPKYRNAKHRDQWRMTLRVYAGPLRDKLPADITTGDVLAVLQPIWSTKPETAKRTQGRIARIMAAAKVEGLYAGENPARWKDHLAQTLLVRAAHERGRHAALPYDDIPAFMVTLREKSGIAARALEFLILTAARSGEVRGMTWAEVDLDKRRWTVPGDRMKAGKAHRVPLTDRGVAILAEMALFRPAHDDGSALVFPGDERSGRRKPGAVGPVQMSDMTLAAVLKRMKRTGITVHGFRSTFQDWAEEIARFPASAVEAALAHTISGTRASYRRGDSYAMRAELMAAWEGYLNGRGVTGNVIHLRAG